MSSDGKAKYLASTLFYAVVIGSAFRNLSFPFVNGIAPGPEAPNVWWQFAAQMTLLLVILEDWYSYFSYVQVGADFKTRVTLKSLGFEFAILLSWYTAFASVPYSSEWFGGAFALFFIFRFFAGLSHYASLAEKLIDGLFLIPAAAALSLGFLGGLKGPLLWFPSIVAWIIVVMLWHALRSGASKAG